MEGSKIIKFVFLKFYWKIQIEEIEVSNGNPYCLPNDIALYLLIVKTVDIEIEEYL